MRQVASRPCKSDSSALHVHVHLPFVVDRAAGIEVAVALRGLKGRRHPFVKRVRGLDVVMAIARQVGLPAACSQSA